MMGNTALITGASSGIGMEFARLHARKGGDVVLVARREEALNLLKQELEQAYGISATVIVADLALPGAVDTGFVAASDLEGAALFQKPGASAVSVAACGYEAMLAGDLVKINEPSLNFALNWVIPLLPRKLVLKLSRKTMEKGS